MKYFLRSLLLFLSPVIFVTVLYVVKDPFKVLYHYDNYYSDKNEFLVGPMIGVDRDYISTQGLINNYPKYHYDSYIFGSSRSTTYFIEEWRKYIGEHSFYHIDASGESLYGIERKIDYMNRTNIPIKNALVLFDPSTLKNVDNEENRLQLKHFATSRQRYIDFQLLFFRDFLDPQFLFAFIDYTFSGKVKDYMVKNSIFNSGENKTTYVVQTNETRFYTLDTMIAHNPEKYYADRKQIFYTRKPGLHYYPKAISNKSAVLLENMNKIFKRYNTDYKIIIGPAYDQFKLDSTDLRYLQHLFGVDKVYDFSGNNEFTRDYHNYYEDSHYRPFISARILRIIYAPGAQDSLNQLFANGNLGQ